jgi:hypothetical protein
MPAWTKLVKKQNTNKRAGGVAVDGEGEEKTALDAPHL